MLLQAIYLEPEASSPNWAFSDIKSKNILSETANFNVQIRTELLVLNQLVWSQSTALLNQLSWTGLWTRMDQFHVNGIQRLCNKINLIWRLQPAKQYSWTLKADYSHTATAAAKSFWVKDAFSRFYQELKIFQNLFICKFWEISFGFIYYIFIY